MRSYSFVRSLSEVNYFLCDCYTEAGLQHCGVLCEENSSVKAETLHWHAKKVNVGHTLL